MRKQKAIQLSIPKPCTENWENMTPNERGRHCQSCNKTVIDFSNFSDRQLVEFFAKIKGTVCGNLCNTQMERLLVLQRTNYNSVFQKAVFATALAAGFVIHTDAQNNIPFGAPAKLQNTITKHKPPLPKKKDNKIIASKNYIRGIVSDSNSGKLLQNVFVFIEYTKHYTYTDSTGKFNLDFADSLMGKKIKLMFIEASYYKEMEMSLNAPLITIDIRLTSIPQPISTFNATIKNQATHMVGYINIEVIKHDDWTDPFINADKQVIRKGDTPYW